MANISRCVVANIADVLWPTSLGVLGPTTCDVLSLRHSDVLGAAVPDVLRPNIPMCWAQFPLYVVGMTSHGVSIACAPSLGVLGETCSSWSPAFRARCCGSWLCPLLPVSPVSGTNGHARDSGLHLLPWGMVASRSAHFRRFLPNFLIWHSRMPCMVEGGGVDLNTCGML